MEAVLVVHKEDFDLSLLSDIRCKQHHCNWEKLEFESKFFFLYLCNECVKLNPSLREKLQIVKKELEKNIQ